MKVSRLPPTRVYRAPEPMARPRSHVGRILPDDIEMRAGWLPDCASLSFFHPSGARIGFIDIIPSQFTLNYMNIDREFRGLGLSRRLLAATLRTLSGRTLTREPLHIIKTFVRNPLMVKALTDFGFRPADLPLGLPRLIDPRLEVILSSRPNHDGTTDLYIMDARKRIRQREYIEETLDPDWETFILVENAIEGKIMVIYSTYLLDDPQAKERAQRSLDMTVGLIL